ncbi:GTP-binding protein [Streptomyces sp. NPDC008150]|uniref:CobW family GTP-binding protein n=1 Tax=Streptomyces sp. NPDC008150 TaxID=3364816 RepID=UPI0036E04E8F
MSKPSTPHQIPVVVLTGFLGSGKTTLLNHLLHRSGGSRIGAVVNDFGAVEIDAMAVAGALGDSTVSLGNGCLCCAVDASELDSYLGRLADPALGIDVIVIEASGLAEPQELVRMVLAGEDRRVVYGGLVEVVDAVEFDATRARHPEIDRHLALADLVVVNKTDRAPDGERVLGLVRSLVDGAAVVPASYGRVDPELLFDCRPARERVGQLTFDDLHDHGEGELHAHAGHLHAAYDSLSHVTGVPLDPRRLMEFLDARPDGLYRIKGYVDFGAHDPVNRYAVHAVGRFLRFYPEPWGAGEERLTQLVLIGSGIDGSALGARLASCEQGVGRDTNGRDARRPDEHGMWGVLRYVQEPDDAGADAGAPGEIPDEPDPSLDPEPSLDPDPDPDQSPDPDAEAFPRPPSR